MSLPHFPLLRFGRAYASLDRAPLRRLDTREPIAEVSQANAGLIRKDCARAAAARAAAARIGTDAWLAICGRAAGRFLEGTLPLGDGGHTQTPDDYVEAVSATNGLPHVLCRNNMRKVHQALANMETVLAGLTRGLPAALLDRGLGEHDGVALSYVPQADCLGVVLPNNSPGVNSLWLPAPALRTPVALKPGGTEPWTPWRLVQAFLAAGAPAEAFGFYGAGHDGAEAIPQSCARALVFGDQGTVDRYAARPGVQVHGPGRSKVLFGEDELRRWREHLDVVVDSVLENGGRSCVNASAVLAPAKGREIAEALAERLADVGPLPLTDARAVLAGFANPDLARAVDRSLDEALREPGAVDLTAGKRRGPRLAELEGLTYLLPTVVWCERPDHPLLDKEYLFPYAAVAEMPEADMPTAIGRTLVVTALTRNETLKERLLASPLIDRLNLGPIPTSRVRWDQPHEGNLFEFLFRRRAIQST